MTKTVQVKDFEEPCIEEDVKEMYTKELVPVSLCSVRSSPLW